MKVLTIVNGLGMGGTERAAQNFSLGYRDAGCDVKVLGLNGLGVRSVMLQQEGIEVFDGSVSREDVLTKLNNWSPDIIHIHRSGFANAEMMSAVRALKHEHNRVLETNVFARPDYSADAALIDVHLQLSKWCLWKWKKWTAAIRPLPLGAVVPYPVNTREILAIKAKTARKQIDGIPENAFILGRIGQPFLSKWDGTIFDVLQDLLITDDSFYLVLIGLPDELKTKLATYPELVRQHVILLPTTNSDEELGSLYKTFDCFLHAARIGESFGMVLAEALLYECPVVALSTPLKDNSQLEVVGHERGGLIVEDKINMVQAIRKLKENEDLRKQYGLQGYEYVKAHYNLEAVTASAIAVGKSALKSKSKEELKQHLLSLNGINHNIHTKDIFRIGENILGELSLLSKIKMTLIHNPFIYRMFLKIKKTSE
ncbi:MAG: glycosyltransferase family 4 protein [Ferruginibacter sp.]|nr:glycosyltransferase family 4 protein [Ferruginibacter sp.]